MINAATTFGLVCEDCLKSFLASSWVRPWLCPDCLKRDEIATAQLASVR
ncbi:hypothetical protein FHT44_004910 [Mycolicibacterium sp. BK634]|nr:hypothetical protein [Mycolicibacterium sp. BK634]